MCFRVFLLDFIVFFFFKQKTAYEMRISDWSSDVCSSDLVLRFSVGFGTPLLRWHDRQGTEFVIAAIPLGGYVKMLDEREGDVPSKQLAQAFNRKSVQIGRASCRERVCQYV